jgi:putative transposase
MELYHALNRGVDRRSLVLSDQDRLRFVHDLFEFNDARPAGSTYFSFNNLDLRNPELAARERQTIVDLHGWCLMDNHYHLLLSEKIEGGVSLFLRKLNVGYANYFNEKYDRSGTLFQGRTKKVLIEDDAHFLHILNYIHLNPLDFDESSKDWRERKIKNFETATRQLAAYRWSSYLDYIGEQNFPSLITRELFRDIFKDYRKEISDYMRDISFEETGIPMLE